MKGTPGEWSIKSRDGEIRRARLDMREASHGIDSNKIHCIGIVGGRVAVGRDYHESWLMMLCGGGGGMARRSRIVNRNGM